MRVNAAGSKRHRRYYKCWASSPGWDPTAPTAEFCPSNSSAASEGSGYPLGYLAFLADLTDTSSSCRMARNEFWSVDTFATNTAQRMLEADELADGEFRDGQFLSARLVAP
jgi:hypothetical protein